MRQGKKITIIAALARNRAIGLAGKMPWRLPGELGHFKRTTMGKPIVMGRKTWSSIGRALPGRQNIVISRNPGFIAPGCDVAGSLDEAIRTAAGEEIMIIGGGQLYRQSLEYADRMILTIVDCAPAADTWFPAWQAGEWRQLNSRTESADKSNPLAYEVQEWVKKTGACETSPEPGKSAGPQA